MRTLTIRAMPWKCDVILFEGRDIKEMIPILNRMRIEPNLSRGSIGHTWIYSDTPPVIWLKTIKDIPCLVHELMYVSFGMLSMRGLKCSPKSEEAYTYTTEDLLRQTLKGKWKKVKA